MKEIKYIKGLIIKKNVIKDNYCEECCFYSGESTSKCNNVNNCYLKDGEHYTKITDLLNKL